MNVGRTGAGLQIRYAPSTHRLPDFYHELHRCMRILHFDCAVAHCGWNQRNAVTSARLKGLQNDLNINGMLGTLRTTTRTLH